MRCAAMFKQENALPRSEMHSPIDKWNGLAGARQDHADVRWHVVAAFGAMAEVIGTLRDEALEKFFQVAARARIGVFHDDDAATGVLNKNGDGPIPDAAFIDLRLHGIGDFVETFAIGANFDLVVVDMHL